MEKLVGQTWFKKQEEVATTKGQMTFGSAGALEPTKRVKAPEPVKQPKAKKEEKKKLEGVTITRAIDKDKPAMCPFCLHKGRIVEFFIYKDGNPETPYEGKAKCPECGTGMLMKTAVTVFNAETFADFVFTYKGFFGKVFKRPVWNARLETWGWRDAFWARYNEQKDSSREPSFSSDSTPSSVSSSDYPEGCSGEMPLES